MKTTATNVKLRKLLTGISNETLIPRPDFQRRLVWSNKHKNAFIRTVLEGLPFPEIYIAAGDVDLNTGEGKEILVDGQQRLTTLYHFFIGSEILKLDDDIPSYKALEDKKSFLEYDVVVRDLGNVQIDKIKEIFLRINSTNYALNPMEINNARFDGEIKKFAEDISRHIFFEDNRVFTPNEVRRMRDVTFTLTIIITMISNYFNRDNELENYLYKYNDEFPYQKEVAKELEKVFDIINKSEFDLKHRVWKKVDLFTLIIELHKTINKKMLEIDHISLQKNLKDFYNRVDEFDPDNPTNDKEISAYVETTRSGTNDRSSRIQRGQIIQNLIQKSVS